MRQEGSQRQGLCFIRFSVSSICLGGPDPLVIQLLELHVTSVFGITISRILLNTENIKVISGHFSSFILQVFIEHLLCTNLRGIAVKMDESSLF